MEAIFVLNKVHNRKWMIDTENNITATLNTKNVFGVEKNNQRAENRSPQIRFCISILFCFSSGSVLI